MTFLLKLKHWQLSLLFLIPVCIAGLIDNEFLDNIVLVFEAAVWLSWIWAIVIVINAKFIIYNKQKANLFKVLFVLLVILILVASQFDLNKEKGMMLFYVIFSICFFIIIYIFNFAARLLKSSELRRKTMFQEYWKIIFLIWIYPIGVWFLQPRINNLILNNNAQNDNLQNG